MNFHFHLPLKYHINTIVPTCKYVSMRIQNSVMMITTVEGNNFTDVNLGHCENFPGPFSPYSLAKQEKRSISEEK